MSLIERELASDGPTWTGRRPDGVPVVRVCSAREARDLRASRRGIVISLRDRGTEPVDLQPGWRAVLRLEVPDVEFSGTLASGEDVSGAAAEIARCLRSHPRATPIVLHCAAGISRSRSTAAALCDTLGWPYKWTVLHAPLYAAVRAALEASTAPKG
jgi:rhodanese-related sulfurtransferase